MAKSVASPVCGVEPALTVPLAEGLAAGMVAAGLVSGFGSGLCSWLG